MVVLVDISSLFLYNYVVCFCRVKQDHTKGFIYLIQNKDMSKYGDDNLQGSINLMFMFLNIIQDIFFLYIYI